MIKKIVAVLALCLSCLVSNAQKVYPDNAMDIGFGTYSTGNGKMGLSFNVSYSVSVMLDKGWYVTPAVTFRSFANDVSRLFDYYEEDSYLCRLDFSAAFRRRFDKLPLPVTVGIGPWCGWLLNRDRYYNGVYSDYASDGRRLYKPFDYGIHPSVSVRVNDVLVVGASATLGIPHLLSTAFGTGNATMRHMDIFSLYFAVDI